MSTLIERIGKSYDEMPYTSSAFPATAPEHLRAVAHLFGLDAPPPERARVLELGCAAGGNLIPFAVRHPQAEVVGVDLSPVQIEAGQRAIAAMGLENLRLLQGNIAEIGDSLGQFDYIICHGVYSWVPDDVRAAILELMGAQLAPDGVAHVSYNTYPGWKAKEIVRDAMMLHGGHRDTPVDRLAYARSMIEFLHEQAPAQSVLAKVMQEHIDIVQGDRGYYVAHEYLELCNAPCYLRDFVAAANASGLAYLGDSFVGIMFGGNYGDASQALINEAQGDQVLLEQMADFLKNRTFRNTLMVRADRTDRISRRLDPARLSRLHLAGSFEPVDEAGQHWTMPEGASVTTVYTPQRNLVEKLRAAWPATVAMAELVEGLDVDDTAQTLSFVSDLVTAGAVRFRCEPVRGGVIDALPEVHPALRRLVELDDAPIRLCNEWHRVVTLGPAERFMLPRLDGRTSHAELAEALAGAFRDGVLRMTDNEAIAEDAAELHAAATRMTQHILEWAAQSSLLVDKANQAGVSTPGPGRVEKSPKARKKARK